MHEFSLVSGLLDLVNTYEKLHRFERINVLKLSFGRLSCIDPGALRFVFEVQSKGTKAEGATLDFNILPIVIHCLACNRETPIEQYPSSCPQCLGEKVTLKSGTEPLQLREMDVD